MAIFTCSIPWVCSLVAIEISFIRLVTRRTSLAISVMVAAADFTIVPPSDTRLSESPISALISLADCALRCARLRTSPATTAKPRPCSPARAASTAAFSARILVWKAIPSITVIMSAIRLELSVMACIYPSPDAPAGCLYQQCPTRFLRADSPVQSWWHSYAQLTSVAPYWRPFPPTRLQTPRYAAPDARCLRPVHACRHQSDCQRHGHDQPTRPVHPAFFSSPAVSAPFHCCVSRQSHGLNRRQQ